MDTPPLTKVPLAGVLLEADLQAGGEDGFEVLREGRLRAWEDLREQAAATATEARADAEASFLRRRKTLSTPSELYPNPPHNPEDNDVLPDSSVARIVGALPEALERERRVDVRWFRLIRGRFWRNGVPWQFDDERITPDSNKASYDINKSVAEFAGQLPWPNGVSTDRGLVLLCWAFFCNVWQLKKVAGQKVLRYSCLAAIVTPLVSLIFGTFLVGELHATTSIGQSKDERFQNAVLFTVLILVLRVLQLLFQWTWEVDIPGTSLRYYMHGNMFTVVRNLKGPLAKRFESPSSVVSLMNLDCREAVGKVWEPTLLLPSILVEFVSTLGIALYSILRQRPGVVRTISIAIIMPFLAFSMVIPPLLYWYNINSGWHQITKLYYDYNFRVSSLLSFATPRPGSKKEEDEHDTLHKVFGETLFVSRYRAFANGMVGLGMQYTIHLLLYVLITVVYILGIWEHLEGNMAVGEFITLTGACMNIVSLANKFGVYLTGLQNGYVALTRMAEVINSCEDDDARVGHSAIPTKDM